MPEFKGEREGARTAPSRFSRQNRKPRQGGPPDWAAVLTGLAEAAGIAASTARHDGSRGERNAKGDVRHAMDAAAHEAVRTVLDTAGLPLRLLSEESDTGAEDFGPAPPRFQLVVDPLDGTDNAARGLPLSAFTAAVLPIDAPLAPDAVIAAIIAPLGKGASPLLLIDGHVSGVNLMRVSRIEEATVTVELNHHAPGTGLAALMADARGVRAYGCASRALALMLTGATHAHVDVRGRLTPESWLAAAAMIHAVGGAVYIGDSELAPAPPPRHLLERRSVIAATTPALLRAVLSRLVRSGSLAAG